MRIIKFLFTLIVGIGFCVYCGWMIQRMSAQAEQFEISDMRSEIISIAEFQEYLNELDPSNPIAVDGKLGPATQAKWDRIVCNNYALNTFTMKNTKGHEER